MIRRNRYRFLIVMLLFPVASFVHAQPMVHMRLDSLRFYEPDGNTRFEFPLSIFRSSLYYRNDSSGNRFTSYRIQMRISHDTTTYIETWDRIHHPSLTENTAQGIIPDLASVSVPPGIYNIEIGITDSAGHFRGRKVFDSLRADAMPPHFNLSSLMICSDLEFEAGNDEFHRNGYRVVPYAEKMFGTLEPILFLYWEEYKQLPDTMCRYSISLIASRSSAPKNPLLVREKRIIGDRSFEVEAIPVRNLPTGSYIAQIIATTYPSGTVDTAISRFFVYSDSLPPVVQKADTTHRIFNPDIVPAEDIHYIVEASILDMVSKLSLEEQRIWAENYWKDHDPTPRTPLNENMEQYRERLAAVDRFKTNAKPGWQTDRGRVYLIYGPPDDIEDNAFQTSQTSEIMDDPSGGNKPFVVWRYNSIGGGVIFIFADVHLFGEYELIHSTMTGEVSDEHWYRRLKGIK